MILIICNNNEPLLDRIVMCDKELILYNWQQPAQWLNWKEAPKYFPKPNLHKKRLWSLVVCCLSDPQQLSESQQKHYIWEICTANWCTKNGNACSQHWSTDWAQFFSTITPNHMLHNQRFRSWTNWATKFCLILHMHLTFCQLSTTSSSILTTFFQGECFHNQQDGRKYFSRVHQILKHGFSYYRNKKTYS